MLEDDVSDDDRKIIGTKEFEADDTFLDQYLATALDWWHGRRKPQGVSLENAGRCSQVDFWPSESPLLKEFL